MSDDAAVNAAYTSTGAAWSDGPERVYARLAEALVAATPVPLKDRIVVDLGSGTGAAGRAIAASGGRPVPIDASLGMLIAGRTTQPSPLGLVAGDARRLPLRSDSVDGLVAAFCLNHLRDPAAAIAEAARVVRTGGPVLVSSYAADDSHPAKQAAEAAARALGWDEPPWYTTMRTEAVPLLSTTENAVAECARAGVEAHAGHMRVRFPELGPSDLLAWRFGMAQLAPFVATLDDSRRAELWTRGLDALGPTCPVLERSIIVIRFVSPAPS